MELELKNVGKIESGVIKLDGITVIAGENNTGKSTVSKMLFCLFHSFYRIEDQVKTERVKTISRAITRYYHETANRLTRKFEADEFANRIVENSKNYLLNKGLLEKELEGFYKKADSYFEKYLNNENLEQLAQKIYSFLQIEDSEIRNAILKKRLDAEFAMKIGHLNALEKETKVRLSIKNGNIDFIVINNEEIIIRDYMNLIKNIIYIDNPFVLDYLNPRMPIGFLNSYGHNISLLHKLSDRDRNEEFSVLDELAVKQKFNSIFAVMNDICDGELSVNENRDYVYRTENLRGDLNVVNLSTGMKSFVMIRKLLENGSIDENGVLVLDEPEIHLHPEWQLKFAEIIVLIQKEFGTTILLNTHSPYFLNAIEVYSEKHGIGDVCHYYLAEEKNRKTNLLDVTGNLERIYEKLAKPLQELENMEYR